MKIIHSIFKTFLLSLLVFAQVHFAYAQTASILPPAKTTFVDQNGKPLTSGTVDFYIPSTTTRKTTWQDAAETIPNTNPVVLDAAGRALILGSGNYRQIVKDRLGNLIWDQITSSTGSGSTPTVSTGDGDLVGTIKPWAGMTAPNQYMFAYGEELSRTTYAALFTAITSTQAVFCTSGSAILSGLSDTTNFPIGAKVEISCVVAGSSTIVSKTSSSITLAANSNVNTNTTAIIYPWGNGNGTTTFNVPDFRGLVIAGNNNMGGVASSILTTTFFGSTNPNSIGAAGGSQSTVLVQANLPSATLTTTIVDPGHGHPGSTGLLEGLSTSNLTTAARFGGNDSASGNTQALTIANHVTGITASTALGGSNSPMSLIQPTKTSNYIIKVTPDTNSATASGVTSLGGMTGSIACGTGLLCTGNNISVSNVVVNAANVNYTADYTGGVLETQALYNDQRVSIVDFGAVADTSTGHASANATAFSLALATGKTVFVPYSTSGYNIGSNVIAIIGGQSIVCESLVNIYATGTAAFSITSTQAGTSVTGCTVNMQGASPGSTAYLLNDASTVVGGVNISNGRCFFTYACVKSVGTLGVNAINLQDLKAQFSLGGPQFNYVNAQQGGNLTLAGTIECDFTGVLTLVSFGCGNFNNVGGLYITGLLNASSLGTGVAANNCAVSAFKFSGVVVDVLGEIFADTTIGIGISANVQFLQVSGMLKGSLNLCTQLDLTGTSDFQISTAFLNGPTGITGAAATTTNALIKNVARGSISALSSKNSTGDGVQINGTSSNVVIGNFISSNNTGNWATIADSANHIIIGGGTNTSNGGGLSSTTSGTDICILGVSGIGGQCFLTGGLTIQGGGMTVNGNYAAIGGTVTFGAGIGTGVGNDFLCWNSVSGLVTWGVSCGSVGTSGATLGLLNANKTDSGNNTFSGTNTYSGQIISSFGTPTIASGACGTGTNGTISGTNQSGIITIGAVATTTCTISFSATIVAPKSCNLTAGNATAAATGTTLARVGAPSTSAWVITGLALASTVYNYICL